MSVFLVVVLRPPRVPFAQDFEEARNVCCDLASICRSELPLGSCLPDANCAVNLLRDHGFPKRSCGPRSTRSSEACPHPKARIKMGPMLFDGAFIRKLGQCHWRELSCWRGMKRADGKERKCDTHLPNCRLPTLSDELIAEPTHSNDEPGLRWPLLQLLT